MDTAMYGGTNLCIDLNYSARTCQETWGLIHRRF